MLANVVIKEVGGISYKIMRLTATAPKFLFSFCLVTKHTGGSECLSIDTHPLSGILLQNFRAKNSKLIQIADFPLPPSA